MGSEEGKRGESRLHQGSEQGGVPSPKKTCSELPRQQVSEGEMAMGDLVCGPTEALLPASTCCSQTSLAPVPVWLLIMGRGRSLGKLPVHGIMC